ncbi:MAG: SpoIIE family protein phosphatase [Chloroflexi bacterium]|nr:SpoIIE family protein phosphatase [Chloroflexota bacterium]MCI0576142.1 SpoIIE family protein phosphatase [Chloroflexota bacterium]MCI0647930.1 SpoIIE family protein phosphatase [Chloroflexota bacterium]MCI0727181.1 SpoIIE family protein phosphatase [Chloroflexota bacterium]
MKSGATTIFRNIFEGLDDRALEVLRTRAIKRTYPVESVLCRQGEVEHTFYVLVEGRVAIVQQLEDGQERLLAVRGPRDYFGELGLLDDTPRMASCVAITDVKVLEVTEEVFDALIEESPSVAYAIMRHVVQLLRENDQQAIAEQIAKNLELQKAYGELQAAQAELVEKERLERELEIAAEVQRTLLPGSLPVYANYRFAAYLRPARQVGGDFYDALELDDEHVGLLLADVADKSVQAALFMAVSRTLFMVESQRSLEPAAVALAVHQGMLDIASTAESFVTAFYGVLHRPSGRLTYVIAGHERPLLIRPDRPVEKLAGRGRFLGMLPSLQLDEYAIQLQPGDRLLIFSDGLPDATSESDQQYGLERLVALLEKNQQATARELINLVADDALDWSGQAPAFDDLTLLAVEAV